MSKPIIPVKLDGELRYFSVIRRQAVPPAGFEPAAPGLEGRCSVQLSYGGVRPLPALPELLRGAVFFSRCYLSLRRIPLLILGYPAPAGRSSDNGGPTLVERLGGRFRGTDSRSFGFLDTIGGRIAGVPRYRLGGRTTGYRNLQPCSPQRREVELNHMLSHHPISSRGRSPSRDTLHPAFRLLGALRMARDSNPRWV